MSAQQHAKVAKLWPELVIPKLEQMAEADHKDPSLYFASFQSQGMLVEDQASHFNPYNIWSRKRTKDAKAAETSKSNGM